MANIMTQQWNDKLQWNQKKEKALKIKNELICQKFDKTTYHNKKMGKMYSGKNRPRIQVSKNTQRQAVTIPCERNGTKAKIR